MQLNDKQRLLLGSWKLESGENFDAYLQAIGIPAFQRMLANAAQPIVRVLEDGDHLIVRMESAFKCDEWRFRLNEPFEQTTVDGRKFTCTATFDADGTITEHQQNLPGNSFVTSEISRWVDAEGKLHARSRAGEVQSERIFVRIE